MTPRSTLFTPGDAGDRLRKALDTEADAVTFDIEDGVAPDRKERAREAIAETLSAYDGDDPVGVRINALDDGGPRDLDALANTVPDYIVLPKVEAPEDVAALESALDERGMDVPIRATVETARGVLAAPDIASAPGVDGLGFGAEDLTAALRTDRRPGLPDVAYARQRMVVAARAAGVAVSDTVYPDVSDEAGLREEAVSARRLGFDGKTAIHPAQLSVINDAFTPDEETLREAREIVEAYEESDGGAVRVGDTMVDQPVYERARVTVERGRAAGLL